MTARADISNARRKKLEERSARSIHENTQAFRKARERQRDVRGDDKANRHTAWQGGEAKPPFYREVLEEGVRRGDVVPRGYHDEVVRGSEHLWGNARRVEELETQLREAEGRIERALKLLPRDHRDEALLPTESAAEESSWTALYAAVVDVRSILAGTEKEGAAIPYDHSPDDTPPIPLDWEEGDHG